MYGCVYVCVYTSPMSLLIRNTHDVYNLILKIDIDNLS